MNKKSTKYLVLSVSAIIMIGLVVFANINKQKVNIANENTKETTNTEETTNNLSNEGTEDSLKMAETEVTIDEETRVEVEKLMTNYYDTSKKVVEKLIESDTIKENGQTVKEINEKREGIESYKNIKTYIRPGLEENTYVVYTSYNMKLYNIKTLAPGMSVLYVVKNEKSEFAILDKPEDTQLNEYIDQLSKEEEISNLILDVNTRLADAMDKDKSLKTFVESLENIAEQEK